MRFALALAVTSAIALTDAAPVVEAEAAVPDVPHRDPADYYKVVAAPPAETTEIPPHKQYKGVPQATEGITVQQAKRWVIFGDPTLNRTEPVRPQLPKTNVGPNRFPAMFPLFPCPRFCERFVERKPVFWRAFLCPCVATKTPSPTITEGHGPKETGKASSTITEGHGPKVTEKASSTITEGHGPKVTEMPSSTITLEHEPKVTEKASSTISKGSRPKKTRKPLFTIITQGRGPQVTEKASSTITLEHEPKVTEKASSTITLEHEPKVTEKASSTITKRRKPKFTEMMPWYLTQGRGPQVTEKASSTITLEHGPKVTKMPSSTKAHGHEETKMSQL